MRMLILGALLALAAPAIAAGPPHFQVRDAADYVKLCTTSPDDANYASAIAFCHGFGVGAYHYYHVSTAKPDRFVCPPNPTPTRAAVINDFVAWVQTRSDVMQQPAVDALFIYLAGAWPCKK